MMTVMTWQTWVQVLGTGAVGALIGLVGVYIAFRLTGRRDTRVASETRTSESVSAVVLAANSLPRRLATWQHLWAEAAVVDFLEACQLFTTREVKEHGEVCAWVLARCSVATAILTEPPSRFVALWVRHDAMKRLAHHMGETAGALVEWNAGLRSVDWFIEHRGGNVH